MVYLKPCLLLLIVCSLSSCSEDTSPRVWGTYTAPDKSFSLSIPNGYDTLTDIEDTEFGRIPVHYLQWSFGKPYHVVMIEDMDIKRIEFSYVELPPAAQALSGEQLLDTSIHHFASPEGASFLKELTMASNISLNNHPGRYFVIEREVGKDDKKMYFLKKYLTGNRLYTLWVITYKKQMHNKQIDQFFDSFRITG